LLLLPLLRLQVQGDDLFSRLSQGELARVLQFVPQQQRLRSCVLVSSSWRAAAMQATTAIDVPHNQVCFRPGHPQQQCLDSWVQAHPAPASISALAADYVRRDVVIQAAGELPLPVHLLKGLQDLQLFNLHLAASLSSSSKQQQQEATAGPPLAALTALTSLRMLAPRPDVAGLSALTRLQELCISVGGNEDSAATCVEVAQRVQQGLVASLPRLGSSLTALQLHNYAGSHPALEQVSCLTRLQRLEFWLPEQVWPQAAVLPTSLTALKVNGRQPTTSARYHPDALAATLSLASTANLCQLSALQELELAELNLHTAVLEPLTRLQLLRLAKVSLLSAVPGVPELLVLTCLSRLQQLQLEGVDPVRPDINHPNPGGIKDIPRLWAPAELVSIDRSDALAAHAAALTASSQLTALLLADGDDKGLWFFQRLLRQRLASGQVHAGLRELVVRDQHGWNLLLQSADAAQQVVRCFPNLQVLRLYDRCSIGSPPEQMTDADGLPARFAARWELAQSLEAFAALPGLTTVDLHLEGYTTPSLAGRMCTPAAWRALGSLPALRSLAVFVKSSGRGLGGDIGGGYGSPFGAALQRPTEESLAELLRCSQLESLDVTWEEQAALMDLVRDPLAPSIKDHLVAIHPQVRIQFDTCAHEFMRSPGFAVHLSSDSTAIPV
jgi:hypothetical protein